MSPVRPHVSQAAWAYLTPYPEVARIDGHVSFEPDKLDISIDGKRLEPEPGQHVVAHGPDRNLATSEVTHSGGDAA